MLTPASTAGRLAAPADAAEVEGVVVEDEAVPGVHRLDQHRHLLVVDVGGAAAGTADQVVMVGGLAGDVRAGVTGVVEAMRETRLDEHVEGAEDGGPAE